MPNPNGTVEFRIRYSETDQMHAYYHARALEWFECGRNELLRSLGKPYSQWESDGVLLPVTEASIKFLAKARYDDLLRLTTALAFDGRARLRFDSFIEHAESGEAICRGHTVHAITNPSGKPIRPPEWLVELVVGHAH